MTATLTRPYRSDPTPTTGPPRTSPSRVVIRPAPRREPMFDDELEDGSTRVGPWDQQLPFDAVPRHRVWRPREAAGRDLPDPVAWTRRLLVGMTETAAGRRPYAQLAPLLSPSVAAGLGAEFERAGRSGSRHWLHRATVGTVRGCRPAEGVAEVCATLDTGHRVRAVALRLDVRHGRWQCVRVQLG